MIRRLLPCLAVAIAAAACGPQIEDSAGSASRAEATPTPEGTPTAGEPTFKPASLAQGLERFGNCMQLETWESAGMEDVAWQSAESEAGGGRCFSCHETGTGAALLSIDPQKFFDENRRTPFVMRLVLGTVDSNGAFEDLVPAWRFRDKGLDPNHPEYILSEDRVFALESFVQLTLDRYRDYTLDCGAPAPGQ